MMQDNRNEYWAAFAIGAVLGIGATLLLAPEKETGAKRILYEIEPALNRARKKTRRATKQGMKRAKRTLRRFR